MIVPQINAIRPLSLPLLTRPLPSPMFRDPKEEHPMKGTPRVRVQDAPLPHVRTLCARSARRELFFEKDVVHMVQTPPTPRAPPKGLETYINSALRTAWFGLGGAPLAIVAGH